MAMSQGERIARLQEQSNRYLSRRQTKDCSQQTLIVQAKASKYLQPQHRTPTSYAVENKVVSQGSQVPLSRDTAIGKNVYSADGAPLGCCATVVASGTTTFNEARAVLKKAEGCAICANPDYSLSNGYSIDLSGPNVVGGVCCPEPNLPNTAKTTAAEQCAACKKFYFPSPTPRKCTFCTPYPSSALYPRLPPAWEDGKYGDDRVPQNVPEVPEDSCSGNIPFISDLVQEDIEGIAISFNYSGEGLQVSVDVSGENLESWAVETTSLGLITFSSICVTETSEVTITITLENECGSTSQSINITAFPCAPP